MIRATVMAAVPFVCAALCAQDQQYANKLPPPYATPSVNNGPRIVPPPPGAKLRVPPGFVVEEYAAGFQKPRFMLLGANKEILLSDSGGSVYVLTENGEHRNPQRKAIITGLDRPYGLALWNGYLYVAEPTSVKRYKYDPQALTAEGGEEIISFKGCGGGHWTRSLLFDRQGRKLYVGVGSSSNINTGDPEERAAINRYNPDGSGHELFVQGTRNPIGLHWYPNTDTLWAAVQERDMLGDDLVPDYFTHIEEGAFYGWPYAYIGPNVEPRHKGEREDLVRKTIVPDILLQSHVAVLDYTFYTGNQFPKEYRGGAFLALHGSSNREQRVGYSVVFLPFAQGKPSGAVRDFLTGWIVSPESKEVWGRPVAVLQLPDGSLLVSDDGGNRLWRVSYKG